MWTKAEAINFAFRKAGIASGALNANPDANMIEDAFQDYQALVNEYAQQMNIRPYNSTPPEINDYTGLSDLGSQAMAYQLAMRLCPEYMIEPSQQLMSVAATTLENFRISVLTVPILERRDDMPVGQGWKMTHGWGAFYHQANIVAGSQIMAVNDVDTYTADFNEGELLDGEIVTSFQIKHSAYAIVTNATLSDNVVTYTVQFTEAGRGWVSIVGAGDKTTVSTIKKDFDVRRGE